MRINPANRAECTRQVSAGLFSMSQENRRSADGAAGAQAPERQGNFRARTGAYHRCHRGSVNGSEDIVLPSLGSPRLLIHHPSIIQPSIHPFIQHLLAICYVPGPVLGPGNIKRKSHSLDPQVVYVVTEEGHYSFLVPVCFQKGLDLAYSENLNVKLESLEREKPTN